MTFLWPNRHIKLFWPNSNFRFFEKKISIFWKFFFQKSNFLFQKIENLSWPIKCLYADLTTRRLPNWKYLVLFCFLGPISQKMRILWFGGLLVLQSAYKTFLAQLKFSIFLKILFRFFEKKIFKNRFFFFKKSKVSVGPKMNYMSIWPLEGLQMQSSQFLA